MSVPHRLLALPACIILLWSPPGRAANREVVLHVVYDQRPPLVLRTGETLAGSIGEASIRALQAAGVPYTLQEVPVRRQLNMVQDNLRPVCALGRIRTRERESIGWFSRGLGSSRGYVALVRRGAPLAEPPSLAHLAARPDLRWGVQAGLHYSDQIDRIRNNARARISTFNANHQHFADLLMQDRIDFVVMHRDEAAELLGKQNPNSALLRLVELVDLNAIEQRYFYCSLKVPPATREALNLAIERQQRAAPSSGKR